MLFAPSRLSKPTSRVAFILFVVAAGYYGFREYGRLSPYAEQGMSWDHLIRFADATAVAGAVAGFVRSAFSARLPVVPAAPVKRSKCAEFGGADWMDMSDAGRLFPETGGIVVGERYCVDKDAVRGVPVTPADPFTWYGGSSCRPLLGLHQARPRR